MSLRNGDAVEDGEATGGYRWPQNPGIKDRGVRSPQAAAAAGIFVRVRSQGVCGGAAGQAPQRPPNAAGSGSTAGGATVGGGVPPGHGSPRGGREGRR